MISPIRSTSIDIGCEMARTLGPTGTHHTLNATPSAATPKTIGRSTGCRTALHTWVHVQPSRGMTVP